MSISDSARLISPSESLIYIYIDDLTPSTSREQDTSIPAFSQ